MRDGDSRVTLAATLARLRRAMTVHHTPATVGGTKVRAAQGQPPAGGTARPAGEARPSLTERQLRVLGVGQPPDLAEAGVPGAGW